MGVTLISYLINTVLGPFKQQVLPLLVQIQQLKNQRQFSI